MHTETLIQLAQESMFRIRDAVGETVGLAILNKPKGECIVVAWVPGTSGFSFSYKVPYSIPLHCNAPGKAFLAALPMPELKAILGRLHLKRHTGTTLTSKMKLLASLDRIRKSGYSIDQAEQVEGCHCIGAAITDRDHYPVAALWTTGTCDMIPEEKFAEIGTLVLGAAAEISRRLAATTEGRSSYHADIVKQAKTYMGENVHKPLDMKQVAAHLKIGYSWFRRLFTKETGKSPNSYHMDLRIAKAMEMLQSTHTPIKEIAAQLGYENQYYFSNIFRKKTGCTPTGYRNQARDPGYSNEGRTISPRN
jgi:DNA-binding IclR family transcriptional regulator/AraC-like DNA-binding protein